MVVSCLADMKDGFYERFESQLQGFQNTYYVGGLLAFELTERNASYSIETVCKHFAIDVEQTVTPYVKVSQKILSRYGSAITTTSIVYRKQTVLMFFNSFLHRDYFLCPAAATLHLLEILVSLKVFNFPTFHPWMDICSTGELTESLRRMRSILGSMKKGKS